MNDAPDLLALPVAEALLLERQPGEQQLFELCRAATGLSALQLDPVFAQFDADDARTFEALQTSLGRMAPIHAAGVVRSMLRWMREQVGIVPLDFDGPAPLGDDAAPLGDRAGEPEAAVEDKPTRSTFEERGHTFKFTTPIHDLQPHIQYYIDHHDEIIQLIDGELVSEEIVWASVRCRGSNRVKQVRQQMIKVRSPLRPADPSVHPHP